MTTWFIGRHQGAIEWVRKSGIEVDAYCRHMADSRVGPGDTVIGTLPVHLAAKVCATGATFYELVIDLPEEFRGKELTAEELYAFNARLEGFVVSSVNRSQHPGSQNNATLKRSPDE